MSNDDRAQEVLAEPISVELSDEDRARDRAQRREALEKQLLICRGEREVTRQEIDALAAREKELQRRIDGLTQKIDAANALRNQGRSAGLQAYLDQQHQARVERARQWAVLDDDSSDEGAENKRGRKGKS